MAWESTIPDTAMNKISNRLARRETTQRIPDSLEEWIPQSILVRFVLNAVEFAEDRSSSNYRRRSLFLDCQPKVLLALLTQAYATGVYRSANIAALVRDDSALAYLNAGTFPDSTTLMRFRRENRTLVLNALVRLYSLAWAFRSGQTKLDEIDWDTVSLLADEWTQEDIAAGFRATAEERILWAIREDSAALDI